MSRRTLTGLFAIAALMLITLGMAAAQETPTPTPSIPTGTPSPVELNCDPAELIQQQTDLAAQLAAFKLDTSEDAGVTLDTLFKVGEAYQELALNCGYIPADAASRNVGYDIDRIMNALGTVYGDPINGQLLYNGDLGCAGCHEAEVPLGPPTESTYTRVDEERLQDPAFEGYTVQHYLVESIIDPAEYVVPDYQNVMVSNFGDRMTLQDLADVVSFLESQDS